MFQREDLATVGVIQVGNVYHNLSPALLVEEALKRGEGVLAANGALRVATGKYTGRSPKDHFIVDTQGVHSQVDWGSVNMPIAPDAYEQLKHRQQAYLEGRDVFVFDGFIGNDKKYRVPIRVINEYAWQNLFIQNLLCRPQTEELADFKPAYHMICTPGFKADPQTDGTNSEAFIHFWASKIKKSSSAVPIMAAK